jgi:hypothetical protein
MTGYEAFSLYESLKLHFTKESYDFFKYNGKTRVSVQSFEIRKDKYYFYKISRKYPNKDNLIDFLVANFVTDENIWVGKLLEEEAHSRYLARQKVIQSLSYIFENDCKLIFESCKLISEDCKLNPNELLKTDGDYPILLTKALRKEIQIETLCILNTVLNFLPMWTKKIADTIQWPIYRQKIVKYAAFLPHDVVKYKLILKKVLL